MAALADAVVAALPLQAGQELQGCFEPDWCGDESSWERESPQEDSDAAGACLQQQHSGSGSGSGASGLGHEGHAPPMNIAAWQQHIGDQRPTMRATRMRRRG